VIDFQNESHGIYRGKENSFASQNKANRMPCAGLINKPSKNQVCSLTVSKFSTFKKNSPTDGNFQQNNENTSLELATGASKSSLTIKGAFRM